MLVSIIIPFYEVELYFRNCLDSVVNQSYRNLEIILVNDCSGDNSPSIAKEYASSDQRIKIIEHTQSLHVGGARNTGLGVAQGDYIWFIDSDDSITSPYAVSHLVSIVEQYGAEIVLFNAQDVLENGAVRPNGNRYCGSKIQIYNNEQPFYPAFRDALFHNICLGSGSGSEVWNKFIKHSFLKDYKFQFLEHTVHQDIPLLLLLPLAKKLIQIPEVYYNYHRRDTSIMRSEPPFDYMDHFKRIADQLWWIYDTYWARLDYDEKYVVPVLLMIHTSYNSKRILQMMGGLEQRVWLQSWYSFLKNQLEHRISFDNITPWPSVITSQDGWHNLFESFNKNLSKNEVIITMMNILMGENSGNPSPDISSRKSYVKEIIKTILPYGVVRYIQIWKQRGK
ncbi:glycosyltransferase [Entomospira nematocerorum]|uniref:Glycosyltransferase n=1 Tax=Entomospira nematocerorum TaxID=2719987 RepID=A0A968GE55_9SPIO|nr:glycosyltransferase family 2 protein [Entomospira nematocera]NIZ47397.1 glycosyltransferase [Entomospira nematocera]WDI34063.1 glycosyltransferase [Entomospira nematocera]